MRIPTRERMNERRRRVSFYKLWWGKFFEYDYDTVLHIWNDIRSLYVQIARNDTLWRAYWKLVQRDANKVDRSISAYSRYICMYVYSVAHVW